MPQASGKAPRRASKAMPRARTIKVDRSVAREAILPVHENAIGVVGKVRGHVGQVLAKNRDRLGLVGGVVEPVEPGTKAADKAHDLRLVLFRPLPAHSGNDALIMPEYVDRVGEPVEAASLRDHFEWRSSL